jgi:hypothetical protein
MLLKRDLQPVLIDFGLLQQSIFGKGDGNDDNERANRNPPNLHSADSFLAVPAFSLGLIPSEPLSIIVPITEEAK